jgi:hypothetical protein
MIAAAWTWTDIRNFEEDPSGYQRAHIVWASECRLKLCEANGRACL